MSEYDYSQCSSKSSQHLLHCKGPFLLYHDHPWSTLTCTVACALYYDKGVMVREECNYMFYNPWATKPFMDGKYLISKATYINYKCESERKKFKGCHFCIAELHSRHLPT